MGSMESSKKFKSSSNLLNTRMKNSKNNSDQVAEIELFKPLSITLKLSKDMNNKFKPSEIKSNPYARDNRLTLNKPKISKDKKKKPSVSYNP